MEAVVEAVPGKNLSPRGTPASSSVGDLPWNDCNPRNRADIASGGGPAPWKTRWNPPTDRVPVLSGPPARPPGQQRPPVPRKNLSPRGPPASSSVSGLPWNGCTPRNRADIASGGDPAPWKAPWNPPTDRVPVLSGPPARPPGQQRPPVRHLPGAPTRGDTETERHPSCAVESGGVHGGRTPPQSPPSSSLLADSLGGKRRNGGTSPHPTEPGSDPPRPKFPVGCKVCDRYGGERQPSGVATVVGPTLSSSGFTYDVEAVDKEGSEDGELVRRGTTSVPEGVLSFAPGQSVLCAIGRGVWTTGTVAAVYDRRPIDGEGQVPCSLEVAYAVQQEHGQKLFFVPEDRMRFRPVDISGGASEEGGVAVKKRDEGPGVSDVSLKSPATLMAKRIVQNALGDLGDPDDSSADEHHKRQRTEKDISCSSDGNSHSIQSGEGNLVESGELTAERLARGPSQDVGPKETNPHALAAQSSGKEEAKKETVICVPGWLDPNKVIERVREQSDACEGSSERKVKFRSRCAYEPGGPMLFIVVTGEPHLKARIFVENCLLGMVEKESHGRLFYEIAAAFAAPPVGMDRPAAPAVVFQRQRTLKIPDGEFVWTMSPPRGMAANRSRGSSLATVGKISVTLWRSQGAGRLLL